MASGLADGIRLERGVVPNCGKRKFMADASFMPSGQDWWVGVPSTLQILYSSSASLQVKQGHKLATKADLDTRYWIGKKWTSDHTPGGTCILSASMYVVLQTESNWGGREWICHVISAAEKPRSQSEQGHKNSTRLTPPCL
jgi:hypothetical protein